MTRQRKGSADHDRGAGHGPDEGRGHRGGHGHGEGHGHLITGARGYEVASAVLFAGRRRRVFDGLVAHSGVRPGDRVLDVGCGTGYLSRRAARAVGPGGRVAGVDPAPEMVAYAARRAPAGCAFQVGAAQALPYRDGAFDAVVTSLALHHIPVAARPAALGEMRRVLRPGGRLLVADLRPARGRLARFVRGRPHALPVDAADATAALIAESGFTVVERGERRPMLHFVAAVSDPGTPPRATTSRDER